MGQTLTTSSVLQCPHGGLVTIASANARSRATGSPIATFADTFIVAGCAFTLPGPKPSPCVRVQWVMPDARVRTNGQPTLSTDSVGLCLSPESVPQGQVVVVATQPKVVSR